MTLEHNIGFTEEELRAIRRAITNRELHLAELLKEEEVSDDLESFMREELDRLAEIGRKITESAPCAAEYEYEIRGYYSETIGWELLATEDSYAEAYNTLRDYNENEPQFPHAIFTVKAKRRNRHG